MPYATSDDMLARFSRQELIERTHLDTPNATEIDADRLNTALASASAEMDESFGVLNSVPLPADWVNGRIVDLCCDIARYRLYPDAVPVDPKQVPEWKSRYLAAVEVLKQYKLGELRFEQNSTSGSAGGGALVRVSSNRRRFTREGLSRVF